MSSRLYLDQIYSKSGLTKIIDTSSFDSNNFFESSNTGFKVNYQSSNAALEVIQSGTGNAMTVNTDKFVLDKDGKVTSGLDIRNSSGTTSGLVVRAPSTQATNTNKALRIQNNSDVNTIEFSYKGEAFFAENISIASGFGINFSAYGSEDSNNATTVGNNLLDDYEEGTFQITVSGSTSGSTTYTSSTQVGGKYTKIGNLVYCEITINNKTFPTFSGNLKIDMPFIKDGSSEFESRSGDVYWYPSSKWDSTTNHTGFVASMYASQSYNVLGIKAVDSDRQIAVSSTNTPNLPGASGIYLRYSISYITS